MFDGVMKLLVKGYGPGAGSAVREKSGKAAGAVGIATNLLLFAIKMAAGLLSGSVAIMADAVNNLTDSGSSIIMLVGFKLAGKPADAKHPFGHARMEYLSGVIVSFVVLFLGLELGMTSIEKIIAPEAADFTPLTLGILAASVLIKLWQCFFYRSVGKTIDSQTVYATSSDSRNDAIATTVVLLGAAITSFTHLNLDGWLGLAVAVFIVVSGVKLIIETGDPLLGMAPDQELVKSIYQKILSYDGIIGIHDLAVHNYGGGPVLCLGALRGPRGGGHPEKPRHHRQHRAGLFRARPHPPGHPPGPGGHPGRAHRSPPPPGAGAGGAYLPPGVHPRLPGGVGHHPLQRALRCGGALLSGGQRPGDPGEAGCRGVPAGPELPPVITVDREGTVNQWES